MAFVGEVLWVGPGVVHFWLHEGEPGGTGYLDFREGLWGVVEAVFVAVALALAALAATVFFQDALSSNEVPVWLQVFQQWVVRGINTRIERFEVPFCGSGGARAAAMD